MDRPAKDRPGKMDRQIARAVKEKKPLPEIDFTLHTMEDGTQVSTLERVCKGLCLWLSPATVRSPTDAHHMILQRCKRPRSTPPTMILSGLPRIAPSRIFNSSSSTSIERAVLQRSRRYGS